MLLLSFFFFFFFSSSQFSSEGVTRLERRACVWLPWAAGLSTAKKYGFIGSECLKLFLTTVSPGVTHYGEHLLLLLSLPGCAWVFSVRCDTSCSLPWHRSVVATVGTFETLHSMAKHERDQSQPPVQHFCPLLWYDLTQRQRPDVVPWHVIQHMIYVTAEQLCSCSATIFSIHDMAALSVLFIAKHMVTAQQKVFHIEFSVVETIAL